MTLIVDAGVLFAQADADEPRHAVVAQLLRDELGPLVTSEFAAAEADYLILQRLGIDVELAFMDDLAAATFQLECLSAAEITQAKSVAAQYRDLRIGLSGAALVVLAGKLETTRIATFDQRAFGVIKPLYGDAFDILPSRA